MKIKLQVPTSELVADVFAILEHPIILMALALVIIAVCLLFLQQRRRNREWRSLLSLPSPPGLWPLGQVLELLAAAKAGQFSQKLLTWALQFQGKYVFWLVNRPIVVFTKPKTIETILMQGQADGTIARSRSFYNAYADVFGAHLGNQSGPDWRWRRQTVVSGFKTNRFVSKIDVILSGCDRVVEAIAVSARRQQTLQVDPLFVELTMRLISYFLLGIPLKEDNSSTTSLEEVPFEPNKVYAALGVLEKQVLLQSTTTNKWLKFLPKQKNKRAQEAYRILHEFLDSRIDLALEIARQPEGKTAAANPLLAQSILVHLAKSPHHNQETLFSSTMALLFAGHDTTAHTLSFTLGELGLNPKAFQSAQAEVDRLWEKEGGLSAETLDELVYVEAVVKESMRLHPVVTGIPLIATQDTEIEGIHIPAGTGVETFFLAAGRDPQMYPQPDEFRPERWLQSANSSQPLLLSFSLGAHYCVGDPLALLEAKLMLALLLRHFDWELENGRNSLEKLNQHLTIFPSDLMPIRFTERALSPAVNPVILAEEQGERSRERGFQISPPPPAPELPCSLHQ